MAVICYKSYDGYNHAMFELTDKDKQTKYWNPKNEKSEYMYVSIFV